MNPYQVVGILVTTKDSTKFTSIYLLSEFAESVVDSAIRCEGQEVAKLVTVLDCGKIAVGDIVSLTYAPSASGKPRLVAINKI